MNMTLRRLGIEAIGGNASTLVMPIGILALVAMMVLPLPVMLLDTFITNILVSLLVLAVALHISPT